MNGESTSIVWPTLGSRTAKRSRTCFVEVAKTRTVSNQSSEQCL